MMFHRPLGSALIPSSLLALGLLLVSLTGCGIDAGFNPAPDERATSAVFRTELEWVPNARMVREDTMPRWQAGRFAFVRGSDQLLVFTHFTSLAEWDKRKETFTNRRDHAMERLWIQIPEGTRLGDVLDAERLEARYMVGYDAGLISDGQFIEPWKATGSLVLLEDHPDRVVVHANLLIAPKRRPTWSVQGIFDVAKHAQGIHAKPLPPDVREAYLGTSVTQQAVQSTASASPVSHLDKYSPDQAADPTGSGAAVDAPKSGDAMQSTPPPPPGSADDQASTPPSDEAKASDSEAIAATPLDGAAPPVDAAGERSIVGMWSNVTPKWYERYQFNQDGTFIHANCRPGYDPAINTGTWEIRNQFIVITTKAYTYKHIGAKSVDSRLLTGPDVGILRMTWVGDDLHLAGTVWRRGREALDMTFTRGNFPDMSIIPPPREW